VLKHEEGSISALPAVNLRRVVKKRRAEAEE